jgi:DNA-binding NtrC family response regulator
MPPHNKSPSSPPAPRSVLLIDDDPGVLDVLERFFTWDSWRVFRSQSGAAGLSVYEAEQPDLVVLDISMPGMDGLEVLHALAPQGATVIMLTGQADLESAVEAMRIGAENFLPKPPDLMHLAAAAERAMEKVELRRVNRTLANRMAGERSTDSLGTSPRMQELAQQVEMLSASDTTTVLLLGESGTGKGWVAQMLHARSARSRGAMVEVNCAALSATFLDSELFGHERGAFTDAKTAKRGLFEVAERGTLFLDEVGDMPGEVQPKLLKVLESKTFRRLGGTQEIRSDARLIAATNKDLSAETKAGRFREDLFYRLSVFPLVIPPLRERSPDDIVELISRLLRDAAPRHPRSPTRLSSKVLDRLLTYSWPGNVRELRNVLERALVLAGGADEIRPEHLPAALIGRRVASGSAVRGTPELLPMAEIERRHIEHTLAALDGNRTLAAKTLGISRATLHTKIRQLGLEEVGRN